MRRLSVALSAVALAVAASSCAVGVRQPATQITGNGATLNGRVLSTTGGAGKYFVEYGTFPFRAPPQFAQRTPTRDVNFVVNQSQPVSEPVGNLPPGRAHYFTVCAEDSENPGDPFCSPFQSFRTVGDSVAGGGVTSSVLDLEGELELEVGSGPAGENVSGFANEDDPVGRPTIGTPRCLLVTGNRAVIGVEWTPLAIGAPFSNYLVIEDGGAGGFDKLGRVPTGDPPTDCAGVPADVPLTAPLGNSTIAVNDEQPPGI